MRRNDEQLRLLYEQLRNQGLASRTILIVTADHGRALHDHGQDGNGLTTYQEEIRVPLTWFHPGSLSPLRVPGPVSLLDIVPSVLDYFGVPFGDDLTHGQRSLSTGPDPEAREILIPRFLYPGDSDIARFRGNEMLALIAGNWKLIRRSAAGQPEDFQLYNLQVDPTEQVNLTDLEPERTQALQRRMLEWIQELQEDRHQFHRTWGAQREPDPQLELETLQILKSLGYIR